jgi:AcrR family transcriptional regulator
VYRSTRTYRGATPSQRVEERRAQLVDAGLSKRYFYESFPDSEALLLACYERCANEIHEAMVTAVAEATDTVDAQLRAALVAYFSAIDADQRRARITLLEILAISAAVDAAYAAQTERFANSIETLAAGTFSASKLPKPQLHIIAQGIIGAITTIATQWLLEHRRRPRAQLIDATHVLVLAVLDRLPNSP